MCGNLTARIGTLSGKHGSACTNNGDRMVIDNCPDPRQAMPAKFGAA